MEWMPIEAAPKNTWVLTTDLKFVLRTKFMSNYREQIWIDDHSRLYYWEPTHWMPLPEPPQC